MTLAEFVALITGIPVGLILGAIVVEVFDAYDHKRVGPLMVFSQLSGLVVLLLGGGELGGALVIGYFMESGLILWYLLGLNIPFLVFVVPFYVARKIHIRAHA